MVFSISTYVLNLVLIECRNGVDDDPWQAATKVDNFVHHERHDAGGEGIILHVQVPSSPGTLENAEVDIDLGDLLENGVILCGRKRRRRVDASGDRGVERGERRAPAKELLVSRSGRLIVRG